MSSTKTARRRTAAADAAVGDVVCGVYLRISQDRSGEALGVTRQREACEELVASLGWTVPTWAVYIDNDTSATSSKPRPAYERMLGDVAAGRVQAVVAWHADRLYRRMADLQRLIEVVEGHHVAIRTVRAGELDLTTPHGRMIARILGSVATAEVEHKSDRWLASLQQHRELGHMPGSGPRMYGWHRSGEVVPEEAAIIDELARRVIGGASFNSLCRELNDRGVKTSAGNVWRATTMRKLLANPRLAGYSVLHGEIVRTDDGEPARGIWQPIIDDSTFETLRALLSTRTRPRAPRVALLGGLIVCGRCGSRLITGGRGTRANGRRTYKCPGPADAGYDGCGGLSGDAEPVERIVERVAQRQLADERVRAEIERVQHDESASATVDELAELRARLAEVQTAMSDRRDKRSVSSLLKAETALTDEITAAEGKLVAATRDRVVLPDGDAWPVELAERRKLVELVVQRVVLHPGSGGRFRPERVEVQTVPSGH